MKQGVYDVAELEQDVYVTAEWSICVLWQLQDGTDRISSSME